MSRTLDLNAQSKIDKGSAKHGEQIGVKVFGNADVNGFASSANMETSSSQHASKKQQTKRIPDQVPPDTPLLNSSPLTYSLTYAGVSTLELQYRYVHAHCKNYCLATFDRR